VRGAARDNGQGLWVLSAAAALLAFALLQAVAMLRAGGVFEYPLDDIYIHLAMAKGMAGGTYGINPGEPVGASSSILYPVLLMPFAGTEMQRMLPLLLNIVSLALEAALWGAIVARAQVGRALGLFLAIAGPLALNMAGVAFTAMENGFHAAAALACVLGLWVFLSEGRIGALLVIGTIAAPMLRLEGLALSGLVCLAILLGGRWRAALALGVATLAPVLAFSGYLASLGLPPLPGSVMAKTGLGMADASRFDRLAMTLVGNVIKLPGALLLALSLILAGFSLWPALRGPRARLLVVVALAGIAHLLLAQIGWMHRYEHYILVAELGALLLVSAGAPSARVMSGLSVVALCLLAFAFWPKLVGLYLWNPREIHLQQAQMARFQRDYAQLPVAVNDLGWVSWASPAPVLDVWGLGSRAALDERLKPGGPGPHWIADLAAREGIAYAMIYDKWFGDQVGADWVRLGTLITPEPRGAIGDWSVSFYAIDPAQEGHLRAALADWAQTLPEAVQFEPAGPGGTS